MLRKILVSSALVMLAVSLAAARPAAAAPVTGENIYLVGHDVSVIGEASLGEIGLGYRFNYVPKDSKNMSWSAGVEYGQGMNKSTSGSNQNTTEWDLSSWSGVLEMNHYYDCCDDAFYCGPTLYYETANLTTKYTGDPDQKYNGINTYGVGGHFGGAFDIAKNARLFGEMRELYAMSSYDETKEGVETKWSAWRFVPSYQAGLSWTFGK